MRPLVRRAVLSVGILLMLCITHCILIACSDAYTTAFNRALWRISAAIYYAVAPCNETLEQAIDRAKTLHSEENVFVLANNNGAFIFDQYGLIGGSLVFSSNNRWRTLDLSYCRNLLYPSYSARNEAFSILTLQWDGTVYLLGQFFSETLDVKVFDSSGCSIQAMCFSNGLGSHVDERYGYIVFHTMNSLEPGYMISTGNETLVFLGEEWSYDANGIPAMTSR